MELKELKCKNCGAKIEINEKDTLATCKYCNTSFSTIDAYNEGYEYTKGVLKAKKEQEEENLKKFDSSPITKLVTIILVIIFFTIAIFIFINLLKLMFLF